ncbi:MAG: phenylalanine--tRNA ligase subunit alpha [Candidatus Altiarchaeota archaeon]
MELHPHEIKVLKALQKEATPLEISEKTGLPVDAVQRAASWLKTKELLDIKEQTWEEITLGDEGKKYLKEGLPERQIIDAVKERASLSNVRKRLDGGLVGIGLGWLRKKGLAEITADEIRIKSREKTSDEELLERLGKSLLKSTELDGTQKKALEMLKQRKNVIKVAEKKSIVLKPAEKGVKLSSTLEVDDSVSQLTPEMLVTGRWKDLNFRKYDVNVYVKPNVPAKKHPLQQAIEDIRDIFIELGFSEIKGPYVESAFWNFDALFTAQDHPVRDMHDTFYLKTPKSVPIPGFEKLKDRVRKTHEDGWTTGSEGWKYKWSEEVTKKAVLRTHTTVVTARYLSTLKREDLPQKVFSIGRVFRNEAIDYKHLPEFYQVEGIIVDEDATFRNLLGILEEFYTRMGFKVRFRPAYFPYTEMSVEPEIYFEEKKEWIELGGAGMFRPEVVKPLMGFECPVLAWGLGVDRVVALRLGLNDIRELYSSSMDWLRNSRIR